MENKKKTIQEESYEKEKRQPGSNGSETGKKRQAERIFSLLEVDDMHDLQSLFKEMVGEVLEN